MPLLVFLVLRGDSEAQRLGHKRQRLLRLYARALEPYARARRIHWLGRVQPKLALYASGLRKSELVDNQGQRPDSFLHALALEGLAPVRKLILSHNWLFGQNRAFSL